MTLPASLLGYEDAYLVNGGKTGTMILVDESMGPSIQVMYPSGKVLKADVPGLKDIKVVQGMTFNMLVVIGDYDAGNDRLYSFRLPDSDPVQDEGALYLVDSIFIEKNATIQDMAMLGNSNGRTLALTNEVANDYDKKTTFYRIVEPLSHSPIRAHFRLKAGEEYEHGTT
jgi:hypothetical protein